MQAGKSSLAFVMRQDGRALSPEGKAEFVMGGGGMDRRRAGF
jgi:hypothetical protein